MRTEVSQCSAPTRISIQKNQIKTCSTTLLRVWVLPANRVGIREGKYRKSCNMMISTAVANMLMCCRNNTPKSHIYLYLFYTSNLWIWCVGAFGPDRILLHLFLSPGIEMPGVTS